MAENRMLTEDLIKKNPTDDTACLFVRAVRLSDSLYVSADYSSVSSNSSMIWQADLATEVPGPKMATTPVL